MAKKASPHEETERREEWAGGTTLQKVFRLWFMGIQQKRKET